MKDFPPGAIVIPACTMLVKNEECVLHNLQHLMEVGGVWLHQNGFPDVCLHCSGPSQIVTFALPNPDWQVKNKTDAGFQRVFVHFLCWVCRNKMPAIEDQIIARLERMLKALPNQGRAGEVQSLQDARKRLRPSPSSPQSEPGPAPESQT